MDKNGKSSDAVALIITAAMMEAGMRDDQEVRELPEAIRKLKDDRPKLKNLRALDEIHGLVMRHSANRELADKIVNHLRWKQPPSNSGGEPPPAMNKRELPLESKHQFRARIRRHLLAIFPNMSKDTLDANSQSFREANPAISGQGGPKNSLAGRTGTGRGRRGVMNKIEIDFAFSLEAKRLKGEILRWEFEGITLRFAGVRYTPDFVVFNVPKVLLVGAEQKFHRGITFIEIKGSYIKGKFERAIERFRHARTYWDCFSFELWQRQKNGWKQIN